MKNTFIPSFHCGSSFPAAVHLCAHIDGNPAESSSPSNGATCKGFRLASRALDGCCQNQRWSDAWAIRWVSAKWPRFRRRNIWTIPRKRLVDAMPSMTVARNLPAPGDRQMRAQSIREQSKLYIRTPARLAAALENMDVKPNNPAFTNLFDGSDEDAALGNDVSVRAML